MSSGQHFSFLSEIFFFKEKNKKATLATCLATDWVARDGNGTPFHSVRFCFPSHLFKVSLDCCFWKVHARLLSLCEALCSDSLESRSQSPAQLFHSSFCLLHFFFQFGGIQSTGKSERSSHSPCVKVSYLYASHANLVCRSCCSCSFCSFFLLLL